MEGYKISLLSTVKPDTTVTMTIATKQCSKCKEVKPIDEFHSDRTNLDGKRFDCIACVSIRRKKYYAAHAEAQRQYTRDYRKTHPEAQEAVNQYQKTNPGRYAKLRCESRIKGASMEISLAQYQEIVSSGVCHYCGGPLPITGHGIDRKDWKSGYSYSNCVPCCECCNRIKCHFLTYEEMLAVAKLLKEMRNRKE